MPTRGRWGYKTPNTNRWPFNRARGWSLRRGRKLPLKALSPKVARKRSDWRYLYTDRLTGTSENPDASFCGIRCIAFGEFCNDHTPVRIPLVTKFMLENDFRDVVTVAKMRGSIQWKPHYLDDGTPCTVAGLQAINDRAQAYQWPIHLRAWLKKSDVTSVQEDTGVGGPAFVDPTNAEDWSDHTGVLREWNHSWMPNGRLHMIWNAYTNIVGVCSNVTRDSYLTPATSSGSQPAFNVPEIETTCTTVQPGEGCSISQVDYDINAPRWWSMSLNRNKPIDLKEDDDLSIFVNWNSPRMADPAINPDCDEDCPPDGDAVPPCAMLFSIDLKMQFQYG